MHANPIVYEGKYKWRLQSSDLYEGQEFEVDWLTFLPTSGGTKYQRSRLITSVKQFLKLRIARPLRKWRSQLSAASIGNWYTQLRTIARWMIQKDKWLLSELTPEDVIEFLASRRSRRNELYPTKRRIDTYINVFEDLWNFRHGYPAALRVDVRRFEEEIWRSCPVREGERWRATNEEFALFLIADATEWLQLYGEFFVKTAERIFLAHSKWVGCSEYQRKRLSTQLFADICEEPLYAEIAAKLGTAKNSYGIAQAFTATAGAAINVLLFVVGFRVSEMLRLDEGCVFHQQYEDGQSVPLIRGVAAKKGGANRDWIAGGPVPETIQWLERFYSLARKLAGTRALFVTRSCGASVPLPGRKTRRMSPASPISAMRAFAKAKFRRDRPTTPRLHPHAARKTFAAFVVRRDKTALEALSWHFGHVFRAFTDGAYASNLDLQRLLAEADRQELAHGLTQLLTATHLAGRAAAGVIAFTHSGQRFRGKLMLRRAVDELIAKGVQLAPCNWGFCLYSEATSACSGDRRGPNEIKRSPEVCAGCANFVASGAHAAWWNERVKNDEVFLRNELVPSQARQVVLVRLNRSRSLLRELLEDQRK